MSEVANKNNDLLSNLFGGIGGIGKGINPIIWILVLFFLLGGGGGCGFGGLFGDNLIFILIIILALFGLNGFFRF